MPSTSVIGGVRRRRSEVHRSDVSPRTDDELDRTVSDDEDYGLTPAVSANVNGQVALVAAALREKNHPERLSPVIAPAAFDVAAYREAPQAYIDAIAPGRVFQPAQPGEDVPQLARQSAFYQAVEQGDSVTLAVEAIPGAPVSFTSFDLGKFSNELTSITVRANEQGVAQAEFFGAPGTVSQVNILAASPQTSGQVKFLVDVTLPGEAP